MCIECGLNRNLTEGEEQLLARQFMTAGFGKHGEAASVQIK